jgi:hypothetical protein
MHTINFICPYCHESAEVQEEELCPVSNSVNSFEVVGWSTDKDGNNFIADDVEVDWGPREVHEPDISEPYWVCSRCLEVIDEDIKTHADLFNWLYKRGMLEGEDPE